MEFERTAAETSHRLNVEREYERIPTAITHFRNMVTNLKIARRQPSATGKREAIDVAIHNATRVLISPYEGREVVAKAFAVLREDDPQLAQSSLRTLRTAQVLGERALRRYLGLPSNGRIFPRVAEFRKSSHRPSKLAR